MARHTIAIDKNQVAHLGEPFGQDLCLRTTNKLEEHNITDMEQLWNRILEVANFRDMSAGTFRELISALSRYSARTRGQEFSAAQKEQFVQQLMHRKKE